MSWILSALTAVLCGVIGGAGSIGIALLCVGWYRIPSREGASGYFVAFAGLAGAVCGALVGLVTARVAHASGVGGLAEFAWAVGVVVTLLTLALGLSWQLSRAADPAREDRGLDLLVELRLPEGVGEFPVKDAAEAYLGLAMVDARTRVQTEERPGELLVGDARLDQGRWLIPGRAVLGPTGEEMVLTVRLGGEDAERFLVPVRGRTAPMERWSDWTPRLAPGSRGPRMSFRYRVGHSRA